MFENGRKTIGVILCDVSSHYQEQICQTLSMYAKEADYNLAYFTFFSCYGTEITRNGRGEANIVHLIPFDHPDTITRLADYKRALANRGIPFDERMVYEGDYWTKKAKEAADYFTMELAEKPEVIVCANDYMASSLMNELIAKGFLVPDDIAVSGFDNIWESSITLPPITTVSVPVHDMVKQAVGLIEAMWRGETVPQKSYVNSEVIFRNSCGCETFNMQSMLAKRVRQMNEYQSIMESNQSNTYMFIDLSDLDHVDGIEKSLRIGANDHIDSFFICLGEGRGEQYPKYCSPANGFAKKSKVVGGLFHKRACVFDVFETSRLLPKDVSEDKPMIYYFFPIHNNQFSYGYLAVSYEDNYSTNKTFNNWLAILGNALEMIRIKQKNQGLLQELNNLYVHDALTGLYNRRGFDSVSLEKYKRAKKEKKSFVIFAIDMDNLKVVNDRFGHMNGDLALRTIGEAMQAVAGKEDACARVGGDEYNVVGIGYTEDMAEQFVKDFNGYLADFNEESELPYLVKASVGYCLLESEKERDLEDCVNAADGKLYEYKRDKKKKKLDNVLREMEG